MVRALNFGTTCPYSWSRAQSRGVIVILTVITEFPNNKPTETLAVGYTKTELIMAELCG